MKLYLFRIIAINIFIALLCSNASVQAQKFSLFPNYIPSKHQAVKSLDDPKLLPLQQQFNATNSSDRGQALTRGEFTKIIIEAANAITQPSESHNFSDIIWNPNEKFIAFASKNAIVSGYNDGTFQPNNPISRAEATKILVQSLGLKIAEKQQQFSDISNENTLWKYIQTAFDNWLISGTSTKTFSPHKTISRWELIKILYNILHSNTTNLEITPKIETIPATETQKTAENITINSEETKIQYPKKYQKTVLGYNVEYISIPKNSPFKVIAAASNTAKPLLNFIKENGAIGWINGAYFDAYTKTPNSKSTRIINGDINTFSEFKDDTGANVIFGFDKNGDVIIAQNMIWWNKRPANNFNSDKISQIEYGIANFPLFLYNGKNIYIEYESAGLIDRKMLSKSAKNFICRTSNNDIFLGQIRSISMQNVTPILMEMWCQDALNLDSGGSSAMYFDNKFQFGPGRNIMDAFVIVPR